MTKQMSQLSSLVAEDEPADMGKLSAAHIAAYEVVLRTLLDIRTTAELRDVFSRELTQTAASDFSVAVYETRARSQPDSFALAWAVESVIAQRRRAEGHDISEMFDSPSYRTPPSAALEAAFDEMWEARR